MVFLAEEPAKIDKNPEKNDQKQAKIGYFPGQKQEKGQPKDEKEQPDGGKVKELTETLQRLQAEFENYQKRTARQNEEYKVFANARLIEEMLPVLDSLEHGMKHDEELGFVYEQLFSTLKKNGLEKIRAEQGMKFDHDTMECMLQEKNPALREDAVASVLISGYKLNGRILRPVKVSVNTLGKSNAQCEVEKKEASKDGWQEKEAGAEKQAKNAEKK